MTKLKPICPPWVKEGHAEHWFPLGVAARRYFNKTPSSVRGMIYKDILKALGIRTYFDGNRWYICLPDLFLNRMNKSNKAERRSA